ncbi:MAG: Rieske 2Fe-2S domain-containing protein [Alphaproteobacteria bacterium]|nr:Rieske 2Fe-2S domain-containing protein [Alphaproteobacteria bacterium]
MSEGARPAPGTVLCALDDIADPGTRSFAWGEFGRVFRLIVARRGEAVFGYVNDCPHTGQPLDWGAQGPALDPTGTKIQCAGHGAIFRIEDGHCLSGPCKDKSLIPVSVLVSSGKILVGSPA